MGYELCVVARSGSRKGQFLRNGAGWSQQSAKQWEQARE
jgi:hypothetical protein